MPRTGIDPTTSSKTSMLSNTPDSAEPKQPSGWSTLPDNILHDILSYLKPPSDSTLASISLASRAFTFQAHSLLFASVTLRSSSCSKDVSRLLALDDLLKANPRLLEGTEHLRLELDNGHRWVFSTILTPPFRTEDPSFYTELRVKRAELDRVVCRILVTIAGLPPDTRCRGAPAILGEAVRPYRSLRVFELSHYTFYPIYGDAELMQGWQSVLAVETLKILRLSDISDFPLALLGYAGEGVEEMEFLRVKLDRRDSEQAWRQAVDCDSATPTNSAKKRLRPRILLIRDCYAETVEPLIACALNPSTFLDFSQVEELTVHPCLAVQARAYNRLVDTVISQSELLDHLIWMSSSQHQVNDMEVLSAADFTRFKKVDLVFDEGFSGFAQLLTDIRDLLRAASNVFRTAPPSPNPETGAGSESFPGLGSDNLSNEMFLSAPPRPKKRVVSSLEELTLRFDLENLTMQSRPESTMSCPDPIIGIQNDDKYFRVALGGSTEHHYAADSAYFAHIKYIWKLDEMDMEVLQEIDKMLSNLPSPFDMPLNGTASGTEGFPHFKRLSTYCVFNPTSSFLLDEKKARDVYEACQEFVGNGLPRLQEKGALRFVFEMV